MNPEQLLLDTTTVDLGALASYAKSEEATEEEETANQLSGLGVPTETILNQLLDVFDQLGHGDLMPALRIELTRRAQMYINQLRGKNNGVSQETSSDGKALQPYIALTQEGDLSALILEAPTTENDGVMKIGVPFYVSGSVTRVKGIHGKLHFGGDKLPAIVMEGSQRIAAGKQPLTVYARHAHAISAEKLPVGRVVGLEQRGGIGRAVIEIAPTADGRDIQALARNKMLNAVSLRAMPGSYSLEPIRINGEEAWDVSLSLDGIDFAPDGPAQPTFGIEMLAAEARVEAVEKLQQRSVSLEPLTLEAVKKDRPDLIAAIEAPFKATIQTLTAERDAAQATVTEVNTKLAQATEQLDAIARVSYMRDLAAKFPDPVKALAIIQETCKDEKTKEAIASKVMPLLLDALANRPVEPQKEEVSKNPFLDLFPGSGAGAGQALGLEALSPAESAKDGREVVTGLAVPA